MSLGRLLKPPYTLIGAWEACGEQDPNEILETKISWACDYGSAGTDVN
jgi:hypothetical protein